MPRPTLNLRLLRLICLAACLLPSTAAFADTSASSVTWSNLSPGDDWTATILDSLFPIATGTQTVTGSMLQYVSAYAMLIAAFWVSYASIMQVHRTAESGKILSAHFSGWVPIRIIMALALMVPVINGYSAGQAIVLQAAKTGIGMARNLTDIVADAIGPQALPLADPIIPGTRRVVMAVMESELCRALLNEASGNTNLVPAPTMPNPANIPSGTPVVGIRYVLASGDADGSATCGSVSLETTEQAIQQTLGTSIDLSSMTTQQVNALTNLVNTVRPTMAIIADSLWTTRDASVLRSMDGTLADAQATYTAALTAAASSMVSTIRNQYSAGASSSTDAGYVALKNLGWSGLGAYYLELSRLNAEVLSMSSIVPTVTMPSWQGLGSYLTTDVAPLIDAIEKYQNAEEADLAATDTALSPNAAPGLFRSEEIPSSPQSTLDQVFHALGITNSVMTGIANIMLSPTSGDGWTDPFAALISLGHILIHISLAIIGGAALFSTKTGGFFVTIINALSGDIPAAIASAGGTALSGVIKALLFPIFAGAFLILGPGITLAYVLPMTPYVYWIAGVAGWFLLIVEAMIAVPLWALAHLVFQGDGLHGRGARGYEVLFSIIFRPVMMIAGLLMSYGIFSSISWLIMKSFTIASSFVFDHGWLTDSWIGLIVLLCMFMTMEMSLALMCFRLISTLPHHIPAMAGMSSISRVDSDKFADDNAGRGMGKATHETAEIARNTVKQIGGSEKQKENSQPGANDATTQALMNNAGRQED